MSKLLAAAFLFTAANGADLSRHFPGIDGTSVLSDGKSGAMAHHNKKHAAERFAPCSTFKIPNSAIALETSSAPNPDYKLKYDPALTPKGDWAQDHTLRTAFKASAVWYFQEMARRAGPERTRKFLHQFKDGNEDVSGPVDRFWLGTPLRISAEEQVVFLKRLSDGDLGLSARTTHLMKEIMVAERGDGWTVRAKTGACRTEGEDVSLWYVGSVERDDGMSYFALQLGARDYEPLFSQRVTMARAILAEFGLLPAQAAARK